MVSGQPVLWLVQVINRFWLQFSSVVWPDNLAMDLVAFLPGQGRQRQVRGRRQEQEQEAGGRRQKTGGRRQEA